MRSTRYLDHWRILFPANGKNIRGYCLILARGSKPQLDMDKELANLDLFRSVAVLMVVLDHTLDAVHSPYGDFAHWLGQLGVMFFFIHTSFVLMGSLERLSINQEPAVQRFYVRRLFRIYPLSIFALLVVTTLHIPPYLEGNAPPLNLQQIFANLLLVQNLTSVGSRLTPLWSLPFEVQMYLVLPFLYLLTTRWSFWRNPITLIVSSIILLELDSRASKLLHYPALLLFSPWFFMGVLAFTKQPVRVKRPHVLFPVLLLFVILGCYAGHVLLPGHQAGWVAWLFGFSFAFLFPTFQDCRLSWLNIVCKTIARYSYAIYLSHLPILWLLFRKLPWNLTSAQLVIFVVLLGVTSVLLYHGIEAPFITYGRLITASQHRSRVQETARSEGLPGIA